MPRSTASRRLRSLTVTLGTLTGLLLLFRPVSADSGPNGIVADPSGRPLPGALVEWTGRGLSVLADSAGRFAFPDSPAPASAPDAPPVEGPGLALRLEGRQLHLEAGHGVPVTAERLDAAGRRGASAALALGAGRHALDLPALLGTAPAGGVAFLRITAGKEARTVRIAAAGGSWDRARMTLAPGEGGRRLVKTALSDSVRASLEGRRMGSAAWAGPGSDEVRLVLGEGPGLACLFAGSGLIVDIASGQTLRLPPERRIQVILAAEGYTRADLEGGAFRRDTEVWLRDVFAVEPLGAFREAFTVWTWAEPSPQRLPRTGATGTGATAFALEAGGGALKEPGMRTRRKIWDLVAALPSPPWGYYPAGGVTHRQARNVVVAVLALDPATGKAGYSGLARRLAHPSDGSRAVNVAFGQDQSHEFLHALANLADEYHDTTRAPAPEETLREESAHAVNVASGDACASLPWRHLLPGGSVNPGARGLIGAFGAGGRYHPELKCLMNGTHHNAVLYGGGGFLRTRGRLCNLCRELTLFRVHERAGVLPDAAASYATWRSAYRAAFYRRFPFRVPEVLPQVNDAGAARFFPCRESPR